MKKLLLATTIIGATAILGLPSIAKADVTAAPAGWTCTGNCGSDTADGNIPLSPLGNPTYQFVSTSGGLNGVGYNPAGGGNPTNGSLLQTSTFSATTATTLSFNFDFITSDGGQYADNAWAALFTSSGTLVSLLYSSTTGVTPLTAGASSVSWLGGYSGQCYQGGCGNTGWRAVNYAITTDGSYYLAFGATNFGDTSYDTGLAIDGVAVNHTQIVTGAATDAPEPASMALLGAGIFGLGAIRRRQAA